MEFVLPIRSVPRYRNRGTQPSHGTNLCPIRECAPSYRDPSSKRSTDYSACRSPDRLSPFFAGTESRPVRVLQRSSDLHIGLAEIYEDSVRSRDPGSPARGDYSTGSAELERAE